MVASRESRWRGEFLLGLSGGICIVQGGREPIAYMPTARQSYVIGRPNRPLTVCETRNFLAYNGTGSSIE
jgi:hypothetical protein